MTFITKMVILLPSLYLHLVRPDETESEVGYPLLGLHMGLGGACQRSKSTRHLVTPIHHYALSYQPFSDAPMHQHHAGQTKSL